MSTTMVSILVLLILTSPIFSKSAYHYYDHYLGEEAWIVVNDELDDFQNYWHDSGLWDTTRTVHAQKGGKSFSLLMKCSSFTSAHSSKELCACRSLHHKTKIFECEKSQSEAVEPKQAKAITGDNYDEEEEEVGSVVNVRYTKPMPIDKNTIYLTGVGLILLDYHKTPGNIPQISNSQGATKKRMSHCTGTLIAGAHNQFYVLTAAHCLVPPQSDHETPYEPDDMTVRFQGVIDVRDHPYLDCKVIYIRVPAKWSKSPYTTEPFDFVERRWDFGAMLIDRRTCDKDEFEQHGIIPFAGYFEWIEKDIDLHFAGYRGGFQLHETEFHHLKSSKLDQTNKEPSKTKNHQHKTYSNSKEAKHRILGMYHWKEHLGTAKTHPRAHPGDSGGPVFSITGDIHSKKANLLGIHSGGISGPTHVEGDAMLHDYEASAVKFNKKTTIPMIHKMLSFKSVNQDEIITIWNKNEIPKMDEHRIFKYGRWWYAAVPQSWNVLERQAFDKVKAYKIDDKVKYDVQDSDEK